MTYVNKPGTNITEEQKMNRLQTSMNHSCLKADTRTKRHNMDAESTKQVLTGAAYFELYIF